MRTIILRRSTQVAFWASVILISFAINGRAVADEPKQFINIPAGDLGPALELLAKQTRAEIVYRPEQVRRLKTSGAKGNLTTREAVEVLLSGTSLRLATDSSGAMLIADPAQGGSKSTPEEENATGGARDKPKANRGSDTRPFRLDQTTANTLEEIVVTARKRREGVQEIPLAITALTGDVLEAKSVRNFDDYARSVPGLSFTDTGVGRERIAIRGIDATVGSTVVGYYLDETPIPDASGATLSAENVGFDPELIDVDRVEVLRGPQGTVFGAGSMGGTIRIIPKAPNPGSTESSVKADIFHIDGSSGPSDAYSGMLNLPIIEDRLAIRMVAWYREEQGFIERQIATPASHLANVQNGTPIDFVPVGKVPYSTAEGGRVALRFVATDSVAIEASIFSDTQYYRGFQDITTGPQNPTNALSQNLLFNVVEQNRNRLTMTNLKLTGDFTTVDLVASASYTRRLQSDFQEGAAALESLGFAPMFEAAPITEEGRDNAFTAELRLSSSRTGGHATDRVQWLLGAYYTYQKGWIPATWTVPGFTAAFESKSGPVAGDNLYSDAYIDWIKQTAVFGEIDVSPIDRLKLTAGARWFNLSRTDAQPQTGFLTGSNAPLADPYTSPTVRGTADKAVYKAVASWQQSRDMLLYIQAAEGFRGGFGRFAQPSACVDQVKQLGFSPGQGEVAPDQLWNYEVGVKSDWMNNRLRVNLAAYRIDWTNVQQSLFLNCGLSLFANAGSVRNTGGELETEAHVGESLSLGASVGYVHSALQQDIFGIPGTKGLSLPDIPQVTAGAFIEYQFPAFLGWTAMARSDYSYTDRSLSGYTAGGSFAPDLRALSLLNARFAVRRDNFEAALYGRNLLNVVERTYLERDVTFEVLNRLRYSVNTPLIVGITLSYRF
jgi:iron complex outermembrane recepter protein